MTLELFLPQLFPYLLIIAIMLNDMTDYGLFPPPSHLVRYQDEGRVWWLKQ